MKNVLLSAALCAGLFMTTESVSAKRNADVAKALKDAYPDATTEIIGSKQINGVKVNEVKITTKEGESTAQLTDSGDFLLYGSPQHSPELKQQLAAAAGAVFKSAPSDIDLYRETSYYADIPASTKNKDKVNRIRLDAVGRVVDVVSADQMKREGIKSMEKASGKEADQASDAAAKYVPDAKLQGVYKAEQGANFYYVDFVGGEAIVTPQGQIFSYREEIKREELPQGVAAAVEAMFGDKATRFYRGEDEFFTFDQTSPAGDKVSVKMRPNGDILGVTNETAHQEAQAVTASHKQKAGKAAAPKAGAKPKKAGA